MFGRRWVKEGNLEALKEERDAYHLTLRVIELNASVLETQELLDLCDMALNGTPVS